MGAVNMSALAVYSGKRGRERRGIQTLEDLPVSIQVAVAAARAAFAPRRVVLRGSFWLGHWALGESDIDLGVEGYTQKDKRVAACLSATHGIKFDVGEGRRFIDQGLGIVL